MASTSAKSFTFLTVSDRAILHDETVYSEPELFNPYRFLTPDGKIDPDVPKPEAAFGFGRRICPGRFFSYPAMWINMASILSAFRVEKPVDCHGNAIEVVEGFTHDAIWYAVISATRMLQRLTSTQSSHSFRGGVQASFKCFR